MEKKTNQIEICPRCEKGYTDYPALSRRDNATDICTKCGEIEAVVDYTSFEKIPIEYLIAEARFHNKIGASYTTWLEWKQNPDGYSSRGIQE